MTVVVACLLTLCRGGASQEAVRLTLNFPLGGSATRVVTGQLKASYIGPTPWALTQPETLTFDVKFRQTFFVSVERVTEEGNGVISVQPMGTTVEGTWASRPISLKIRPDGSVTVTWGPFTFESSKLKPEEEAAVKKMFTSRAFVTITPGAKIVNVSVADVPAPAPEEAKEISRCLSWLLQVLTPVSFPDKPLRPGEEWTTAIPFPIFEGEKVPELVIQCRLKEIRGSEAVIQASTQGEGPADLTLKRAKPEDPQVTIKSGQVRGTAQIIFDLFINVPRKSVWSLSVKGEGIVTAVEKGVKKTAPFSFEATAEVTDEILY